MSAAHTPVRPPPFDPLFHQKLVDSLNSHLFRQGLRRAKYGPDVADEYRPSHTPERFRLEYKREQEAIKREIQALTPSDDGSVVDAGETGLESISKDEGLFHISTSLVPRDVPRQNVPFINTPPSSFDGCRSKNSQTPSSTPSSPPTKGDRDSRNSSPATANEERGMSRKTPRTTKKRSYETEEEDIPSSKRVKIDGSVKREHQSALDVSKLV